MKKDTTTDTDAARFAAAESLSPTAVLTLLVVPTLMNTIRLDIPSQMAHAGPIAARSTELTCPTTAVSISDKSEGDMYIGIANIVKRTSSMKDGIGIGEELLFWGFSATTVDDEEIEDEADALGILVFPLIIRSCCG